jgi:chromosome segregation ATPase
MCKKLLIAAVAVFVGLMVIRKTEFGTYLQNRFKEIRTSLKSQVPPEAKVRQLEEEIGKIDKDIRKHVSNLAGMEVEYKKLAKNVEGLKEKQTSLKDDVSAMLKVLDGNDKTTKFVSFNGQDYRRGELTNKLERSVRLLENNKSELRVKEEQLKARKQALEVAHQRIGEMKEQKDNLIVLAEELKTQLEILKLAQLQNKVEDIDNTQVSRCNELAREVETQILKLQEEQRLLVKYNLNPPAPSFEKENTKPTANVLQAARKALEDDDKPAAETNIVGKE